MVVIGISNVSSALLPSTPVLVYKLGPTGRWSP